MTVNVSGDSQHVGRMYSSGSQTMKAKTQEKPVTDFRDEERGSHWWLMAICLLGNGSGSSQLFREGKGMLQEVLEAQGVCSRLGLGAIP